MVLAADKALETAIEQALAAGEPVDRSTGDPEADDPAGGASWGAERTVSADFLIRLLTGVRGPKPAAARSLKLQGVKITGRLNLEAASLVCPVSLTSCYFDAPINLSEARAPAIRLPGCHVSVLDASQLETQGNLSLSGLNATGYISLQGAHIGGSLDLSAATLASLVSPGRVLDAGSITVEQHMFCTGGFTAKGLVDLQGAHIRGSLLFSDATLSSPAPSGMVLNGASMTVDQDVFCTGDFTADGTINLMGANIGMELDLHGATLTKPAASETALNAESLTVGQRILCTEGFRANGLIDLQGAHVKGSVHLGDATLTGPGSSGLVLHAASMTVDQDMNCNGRFRAEGTVNLRDAHVRGSLNFGDATLTADDPSRPALSAVSLTVDQDMSCNGKFRTEGAVLLNGAKVGMELSFAGATLTRPDASGTVLSAPSLTVGQAMFCSDGFQAEGTVNLQGARVDGSLIFDGASLKAATTPGTALSAPSLAVGQDMFCANQFQAEGTVNLQGAHVSGSLVLTSASMKGPDASGTVLNAPSLAVDQDMSCREFKAEGMVNLQGANIGMELNLTGAKLKAPDEGTTALNANSLTVGQGMFCSNQFQAEGTVNLQGAHIKGSLTFDGATLQAGGEESTALNARSLTVDQDLRCGSGFKASGVIVLCDAHSSHFYDDKDSWPSSVQLEGFTYETLRAEPEVKPRERIRWLRRDGTGYRPHSYEQLGAAYRRAGYDDHSRRVAIAKQWHRRKAVNPLGKLWNWLLYLIVGYGYRTWLAGIWLLVLIVVGERAFAHASADRLLVAAKDNPAQQPALHAAVYALDLLLPIVSLGQDSAWIPFGWARWWVWGFVLAGWILTTAVVAGLSGLLKRD